MSEHSDTMNALIRGAAAHEPAVDETPAEDSAPPSFDGGARTTAPATPPSMSRLLRAALRKGPPDAAAERWLAEH